MTDLAELEQATHRVLAHYTRSIDSKDRLGLREVFADDCVKERLGLDRLSGEALMAGGKFWLDVIGEYRVCWRLLPAGWRAMSWCLQIFNATGDPRAVSRET